MARGNFVRCFTHIVFVAEHFLDALSYSLGTCTGQPKVCRLDKHVLVLAFQELRFVTIKQVLPVPPAPSPSTGWKAEPVEAPAEPRLLPG